MRKAVRVGDVGTVLECEVLECGDGLDCSLPENWSPADISDATLLEMVLRKPDKTTVTKTGALSTDGTDGLMRYVVEADVLDDDGTWQMQGRVTTPSGVWSTSISSFAVYPNL